MTDRFYIVGSQRSGTTLMRMILHGHPDIETFGDTDSIAALDSGKFPSSDKKWIGLKPPFLTDWLYTRESYTGEPLVFMVRSPRDVVASMVRLANTEGWLIPAYTSQASDPDWSSKYGKEIQLAESSLVGKYALYVRSKMESYFDYLAKGVSVVPVIYEDLVEHPEDYIRRVVKMLGLRYYKKMLDITSLDYSTLSGEGMFYDTFSPDREIDSASVGRYLTILGDDEIDMVDIITDDVYDRIVETV